MNFKIKKAAIYLSFLLLICGTSCKKKDNGDDNINPTQVTIDPTVKYQQMVGFGGALSWYCERVLTSSQKNEICNLIFKDLGADIIRLKNWYYPVNYPADKNTTYMVENFGVMFIATNLLYALAKQYNPDVKILLSSWSPPSSIKSGGLLNGGTLKKGTNGFMYDEFATYWNDILDKITFKPDYISIQNEPGYINTGWATCDWRPTETSDFPGYDVAFDKISQKIQARSDPPIMIGPESANIGGAPWDYSLNTFSSFSNPLKNKSNLGMYAFHIYNFNETSASQTSQPLFHMISSQFNNKPNIMTEYSGMSWFKTAGYIQDLLSIANSSGYIHWELVWDIGSKNAMVKIDVLGTYALTPFYYLIKHFSKYIDRGYTRIKVTTPGSYLNITGFINTTSSKITLIVLNNAYTAQKLDLSNPGVTISNVAAYQSIVGDYFRDLGDMTGKSITLPDQSITTIVADMATK